MDRYAVGRIVILMLIGMFVGYTLVSLFGIIIGTILSILILFAYIKVMNRIVDDDSSEAYYDSYLFTKPKNTRIKLRYRCLTCYNIHNERECPKCRSKMKEVEF